MKGQLRGVALILIGIQLTLLERADLRMIPVIGRAVRDVRSIVIVLPALAVSALGLFLCFRDGPKQRSPACTAPPPHRLTAGPLARRAAA